MAEQLGVLRPPGLILSGPGVVAEVGPAAARLGSRVLVCTDPQLAGGPHVERVLASLRAAGFERPQVLDAAVAELPLEVVEETVARSRELRPEVIVAVGGGSSLDLGKLVSLGCTVPGPISDFYGEGQVPGPTLPVIGVPTTAGTGSEVTPVAVLSDPGLELKVGISSPNIVPAAAICDPELTMGAPSEVTANAGIDALAHAIEAYTAMRGRDWAAVRSRVFVGKNALSDRFALHAVSRISSSLVAAMDDDPEARAAVLEGSLCAGLAFATAGTAIAHALQYPVGARTKTPHGLGIGLLLPYVMRFNYANRATELGEIGAAMGVEPSAEAAVAAVARLRRQIELPLTLAELGLGEQELPEIAAQALGISRLIDNSATPIELAEAVEILRQAWRGDLDLEDAQPIGAPA